MALGSCIGLVRKGLGIDDGLSGPPDHGDHLVRQKLLSGGCQGLNGKAVEVVLCVTEGHGMLGIRRDSPWCR